MKILVCADLFEDKLSDQTANAVSAAKKLGDDIDLLFTGEKAEQIASVESYDGVKKHVLAHEVFNTERGLIYGNAELTADIIVKLSDDYDAIIASATTTWKNILPRAAALLDHMMLSDVIEIIDENVYKRPIYAGNAIATVKNNETKKIFTIRTTAFPPAEKASAPDIQTIPVDDTAIASQFISAELSKQDRPQLTSAKIVVSGGRALGSSENFTLIEKLADQLGAAIGASRAAVDAGYISNDYQVGQTGKVVAPSLYIAIGISGAIQHLAGMKESKVIVAINKDPEAPIFNIADYGLVGDLFEVIPELQKQLEALGYSA